MPVKRGNLLFIGFQHEEFAEYLSLGIFNK